ncbi:MAG: HAD-IA family hydrolase [Anaerolineaceae bacterium]|nr:HAD-IA family hydrolase [Anaerolineaceae bacterium]
MPIEAVVFDMDGVLMDSELYWKFAREDFAASLHKPWSMDDQRACMGRNTVEWAQVMKDRLALNWSLDDIINDTISRVLAQYDAQLPLRAGAIGAVERMATRYKVALASGSPTAVIDHAMDKSGLGNLLQVRVYGDAVPNGKPAPDIYLETLRLLGVQPQNSAGIEDSSNGIRALHNAGMKIIAAPSEGFDLPSDVLALANHVVVHMDEITMEVVDRLA